MSGITIKQISVNDGEYQQVWQLREDVLRKPIGLSLANEDLGRDKEDQILVALKDNHVIGCLMLRTLPGRQMQLRQMAVAHNAQGAGIGRALVLEAEKTARHHGMASIVLHARQVALGFYEKLGYRAYGDVFTEVGMPHFMMEKAL